MAYKELQDFNTSGGIDTLFQYSAEVVPVFPQLIIFAIFIITTFGTFFAQKRLTGRGDMAGSFAVGSWFTAIIAIMMSMVSDFIATGTIVFTIALAILGTIWLYFSRQSETTI